MRRPAAPSTTPRLPVGGRRTGLSNDYLNHFNEVLMLVEIAR